MKLIDSKRARASWNRFAVNVLTQKRLSIYLSHRKNFGIPMAARSRQPKQRYATY
jgi:hypothetical protein